MISVEIKKNQITVSGHADWAKSGFDIVCSSVSTAVIMTINQIEIFELTDKIKYEVKDGFSEIIVIEEDDVINKILLNLTFTLKNLELDYPKYIKIYENL